MILRIHGSWELDSSAHVTSDEFADHWAFIMRLVDADGEKLQEASTVAPLRLRIFWKIDDRVFSEALNSHDLLRLATIVEAIDISVV